MRASALTAIVFANTHDESLRQLTNKRSIASVPFGARYRLVDFALSNLVNAGVGSVGLVTKENYRSLMDHVGNGVHWDLDRKRGGLYLLPPYNTSGVRRYTGKVDALMGAMQFLVRGNADYVILCDANVVANVDIHAAVNQHIETGADITIVYHNGIPPVNHDDVLAFKLDSDNRIIKADIGLRDATPVDYCLNITVISRELLVKLVTECDSRDGTSLSRDILMKCYKSLKVYGFRHNGYAQILDSMEEYFNANMRLLNTETRRQLFPADRPILTKTRDDMPTRYGTKSDVRNCYIADGCVIDGTVTNSVLFRGVKVAKGAVVDNCILMQEVSVAAECQLDYVISDKNAVINPGMVLKGTKGKSVLIKKNQVV